MGVLSKQARRGGGSPVMGKVSAACVLLLGLGALGSVQAATLTCGTPLRVNTANKAQWSTDARYVAAPNGIATIVDSYKWSGWLDLSTNPNHPTGSGPLTGQALQGKWLSFGATADETTPGQYPAVNTKGVVPGAWVANRATFIYNEPITIGPNVNLATIKIQGSGSADNDAQFAVRPKTLPGGVDNSASATPWTQTTALSGVAWGALAPINLDGSTNGLGFYYGDNTIGLALNSEATTASLPTGVVADFEITADCLTPVPPPPTTALMCPAGNKAGDPVKIGPFTTSARDWKWTWRNQAAPGTAVENVEQPLFDDFIWRSYFKPASLTGAAATAARWISPGTVDPIGTDIPGVPYPMAQGQAPKTVLTLNQPITVGNNVDLNSIKLDGRFGFDNVSAGVFVQPAGKPAPTTFTPVVAGGYTAFGTTTTAAVPGFLQGQNTLGLAVNGGEAKNDCAGGGCAMAAIADFYVTGTCTGEAPVLPPDPTQVVAPVPTLDLAGLGLLGLLSAGLGALGLRRRKNAQ